MQKTQKLYLYQQKFEYMTENLSTFSTNRLYSKLNKTRYYMSI